MDDFIALIMKNLTKHGFPNKKVSLGLETMYERAEDKGLSMNKVLDELRDRGVEHHKKGDKIIFFQPNVETAPASDFLTRAQEMMGAMDQDELGVSQAMVQERLKQMNPEERDQLFKKIKDMGLV
jgi:hypothetical protein